MSAEVPAEAHRGLIGTLGPRAVAVLVELAGVVVAVRLLGLHLYGAFQAAAVSAGLAVIAIDAGRQMIGTRDVASTSALPVYRTLTRPRRMTAVALGAAAVPAYVLGLGWLGAAFAIAAGAMAEQRWALLATRLPASLGLSFLARPCAVLLALGAARFFSVSHHTTAVLLLPLVIAFGGASVAAIDAAVAGRSLSPTAPTPVPAVRLRLRLPLTVAALLAAGYVSGDLLLVRLLGGAQQAGLYAVAYKPVTALLVLVALLRDIWIADLARPAANGSSVSPHRALWGSGIATAVLFPAVLVLQPVRWLTGARGADTVTALLLLSVVPIVGSTWLYAIAVTTRRLVAPLPAVAAALAADVAANALLVPHFGARGGAIATLVAEMASTAAAAWVLFRTAQPAN